MKRRDLLITCIWSALVLTVLISCSGNYGKLRASKEVRQSFQNYEMQSDYRYYFRGRAARPTAIVGIDPNFDLNSPFWTPIDPAELNKMVGRLSATDIGVLSGAYLISPNGRTVGVWYSWVNLAAIKFDGNQITIKMTDSKAQRI